MPYLSRTIYFICIWQFLFHFTFLNSTVCFSAFIPSVVPSLSDNYTFPSFSLHAVFPLYLYFFGRSVSQILTIFFIVCAASKRCLYLLFKTHILVPSLNVALNAMLCSITSVTVVVYLLIFLCNVKYFWQTFSLQAPYLQILEFCFMNRAT